MLPRWYYTYVWFAVAIARMEGYMDQDFRLLSGNRAVRNRNPGNIRNWSSRLPKDSGNFTIFPSDADGWAALFRQIGLNINRDLTLAEFFGGKPGVYAGYAPSFENNTANYVNFVRQFVRDMDGVDFGNRSLKDVFNELGWNGWPIS